MISVLSFFFPGRCLVCGKATGIAEGSIHAACKKALPYIRGKICRCCGRKLSDPGRDLCITCLSEKLSFSGGASVFLHEGAVREALYGMKYGNRREYAAFFAEEMAKLYREKEDEWKIDLIIPVPLHRSRKRRRGYNQAALIARRFAGITGLPVSEDLLFRRRKTGAQYRYGKTSRKENLKGAFAARGRLKKAFHVLVIDDIFTTGSTVSYCAEELLKAGAGKVFFMTASSVREKEI